MMTQYSSSILNFINGVSFSLSRKTLTILDLKCIILKGNKYLKTNIKRNVINFIPLLIFTSRAKHRYFNPENSVFFFYI